VVEATTIDLSCADAIETPASNTAAANATTVRRVFMKFSSLL
jgi:hypothetical protein